METHSLTFDLQEIYTCSSKCSEAACRRRRRPEWAAAGWPSAPSSCWPSPPSPTCTIAARSPRSRRLRKGRPGTLAQAVHEAIDVETEETNKQDQDTFEKNVEVDVELEVQKAPLSQPSAYLGGQSLPPWPYPETRPTTPASYDPACILKVSWPRDTARPTEDTLRETFQALAPVLNVGLGSGNAAMVVFKDAAGARAAQRPPTTGRGRTAPAKPPRPPLISRRRLRRPRRARCDGLPPSSLTRPVVSPRCIGPVDPLPQQRHLLSPAICPLLRRVENRCHIPPCGRHCPGPSQLGMQKLRTPPVTASGRKRTSRSAPACVETRHAPARRRGRRRRAARRRRRRPRPPL